DPKEIPLVVVGEARRRPLDAGADPSGAGRRAVPCAAPVARVPGRLLRRRRRRHLAKPRLHTLKRTAIVAGVLDVKRSPLLNDVVVAVAGIRVIAQPLRSAAAPLLLDR